MKTRGESIFYELRHHVPFTLVVSLVAGFLIGFFYLSGVLETSFMEVFFEFTHPAHVLVSAAATAALYTKYKKSFGASIIVGFFGALLIGTLSDVLLPWISGILFGLETELHLPFIEEPILIFGAAFIGAVLGKSKRVFVTSHGLHIFLSVFASLAYLLAYSVDLNFLSILIIAVIVFFVVYIPCCISDIVFPLLFVRNQKH